ncbi:MAG: polysaccharide biosynthesis/export family protein [Desulfomicrobium escambiense]|nr:polysaccharide biosynthesis/export family protein [Desulfomicrobium escambiense]
MTKMPQDRRARRHHPRRLRPRRRAVATTGSTGSAAPAGRRTPSAEYKIGPKDLLEITVLGVPEISQARRPRLRGGPDHPAAARRGRGRQPDQVRGREEADRRSPARRSSSSPR